MNTAMIRTWCKSLPASYAPYAEIRATESGLECRGTPECAYGDGSPSRPSLLGRFCAGWSFRDGSFLAATDAQGNAPLFYARINGGVAVSNNAIRLIERGVCPELDEPALAQMITMNFVTGDRTVFSEIKVLPPGGILSLSGNGEVHIERADQSIPAAFSGSSEDGAQRYAELFEAAMACTPENQGRTGTPLSGGRDSRMLAAAIKRAGADAARVLTLSRTDQADRSDAVVAEQVANALGIPIQRTGIQNPGMISEVWKNVLCSCLTLQHGWLSHVWIESARRFDTVYDGFGCGVATRTSHRIDDIYRLVSDGDISGAALRYIRNIKARPAEAGLPDWMRHYRSMEDAETECLRLLESEIQHVRSCPDPMGALSMYCENRRAIALSPHAMTMLGTNVRVPLADDELCSHALSLSRDSTDEQEPQTRAIAVLYPEVSGIPYSDGSGPPRPTGLGRISRLISPDRMRSKLVDVLMDPSHQLRSLVSTPQGGRTMASRMRALGLILQTLDSPAKARELLDACRVLDKPSVSMIELARDVWDEAWKHKAAERSEKVLSANG